MYSHSLDMWVQGLDCDLLDNWWHVPTCFLPVFTAPLTLPFTCSLPFSHAFSSPFCSLLNVKLLISLQYTGISRLACVFGNRSQYLAPGCLMCHSALPFHVFTTHDSSTMGTCKMPLETETYLVKKSPTHLCKEALLLLYIFYIYFSSFKDLAGGYILLNTFCGKPTGLPCAFSVSPQSNTMDILCSLFYL